MTSDKWHIECLGCGHRFVHEDAKQVVYNAGYDWADGDTFCPNPDCGKSLQDSPGYEMHGGPVPYKRPLVPIEVLLAYADKQAIRFGL